MHDKKYDQQPFFFCSLLDTRKTAVKRQFYICSAHSKCLLSTSNKVPYKNTHIPHTKLHITFHLMSYSTKVNNKTPTDFQG